MDQGGEDGEEFRIRTSASGATGSQVAMAQRSGPVLGTIGFFSLPRKIRDKIYKKVLRVRHPIYLFQDGSPRVETFGPERPPQWLELLKVNRQMNTEASEVLFKVNHFTLLDERMPQDQLLEAFLTCIGPANSASLSHLSICFPALEEGPSEDPQLRKDSRQRLGLLHDHCTNLETLEITFDVKNIRDLERATEGNPQLIRGVLSHCHSQLKLLPLLRNIIVRATGPMPSPSTTDAMQALGWIVLPVYGHQS
jgi:hypothetical protein